MFDLACFFLPSFSHFSLKHVHVGHRDDVTHCYLGDIDFLEGVSEGSED